MQLGELARARRAPPTRGRGAASPRGRRGRRAPSACGRRARRPRPRRGPRPARARAAAAGRSRCSGSRGGPTGRAGRRTRAASRPPSSLGIGPARRWTRPPRATALRSPCARRARAAAGCAARARGCRRCSRPRGRGGRCRSPSGRRRRRRRRRRVGGGVDVQAAVTDSPRLAPRGVALVATTAARLGVSGYARRKSATAARRGAARAGCLRRRCRRRGLLARTRAARRGGCLRAAREHDLATSQARRTRAETAGEHRSAVLEGDDLQHAWRRPQAQSARTPAARPEHSREFASAPDCGVGA